MSGVVSPAPFVFGFRPDSDLPGYGSIMFGPVKIGVSNEWSGGFYGHTDEADKRATMDCVRQMLEGNLNAGAACFKRVDSCAAVAMRDGMFTVSGGIFGAVFGESVELSVPYSDGGNKEGIDAFLRFLLDQDRKGWSDEESDEESDERSETYLGDLVM